MEINVRKPLCSFWEVSPLPLPQAASVLNYRAVSPLPSQNVLRLKHPTCSSFCRNHLKESLSFQLLRAKALEAHVILNVSFITKFNFCCRSPEQSSTVQTFLATLRREQPILVRLPQCLARVSATFNWFCCYSCPSTLSDFNKTQVKQPEDAVLQPAGLLISG